MDSNRPESNRSSSIDAALRRDRLAQLSLSCAGDAEMRVLPDGSKIVGMLRDLSVGGCRIEYDTAIPIQPDSAIEVQLSVDGFPLRLAGIVSMVDAKTGAGIQFTNVSARKADQIRSLMNDIIEVKSERIARLKKMRKEIDDAQRERDRRMG